jgi:hypothetical protein
MIELPPNWKTYYIEIKDRCTDLISYKIWNGLDIDRLNIWLKNFRTDEEKYLSACILDSLMYRSNSKTKALIYHLFNVVLPNFTRLNPTPIGPIDNWLERLRLINIDPQIRIVAAVSDSDPPTKSSHLVLRLFSKEFEIHDGWIINPQKMMYDHQSGIRTFIFMDDFMGSGHQFRDIAQEYGLANLKDSYVLYAPLVAHEIGCALIEKEFEGKIKIASSEYLTKDLNFFERHFQSQPENAKEFYKNILKERKITTVDKINTLGYGDLQIAYSFEHACPDNCLNLLWKKTDEWNPLFNQ